MGLFGRGKAQVTSPEHWDKLRRDMVEKQLRRRDITDERVLEVMGRIPRHEFIPEDLRARSYNDHPTHIGEEQTISQPYIVALMTQLLKLGKEDRVLEVGTGSGYQTAVLKELAGEVYSLEIRPQIHLLATTTLARLGYDINRIKLGDGYFGWPEAVEFDKIIVTAACRDVPEHLLRQLKDPGYMVFPCGGFEQNLVQIHKQGGKTNEREIAKVRFVSMATNQEGG